MTFTRKDILRCSQLSENLRTQAAKLAAEAMSGLYDPIADETVPMLAREFLIEGSELSGTVAAVKRTVLGILASYPAREYRSRQSVSLHHALTNLSATAGRTLVAQLRTAVAHFPSEEPAGEYLARIAVQTEVRGLGVADALFRILLSESEQVSLHVRLDNARAISFYRRHGLVIRAAGTGFALMQTT